MYCECAHLFWDTGRSLELMQSNQMLRETTQLLASTSPQTWEKEKEGRNRRKQDGWESVRGKERVYERIREKV